MAATTAAADPGPPGPATRRRLLDWYRRNRRDLPWRRRPTPYRVWVSEVMLQQTTVKAVVPYYRAFLRRFPSLRALAGAQVDDVLAAWSGLGYYRRARNLHRGARFVLETHSGRFPRSLEGALQVPGVGLYTASAVLSICFDAPHAVVDGNVRRVLTRLLALRGSRWARDAPFHNLAREWLDPSSPGDWNQAVMELGATICTPRTPRCPACPLRQSCRARRLGLQDELPEARARRAPVDVTVAGALIEEAGRVLLVRRREGTLMSRLWEVPQSSLDAQGPVDLAAVLRERHGLEVEVGPLVSRARHAVTHRRIRLEGYRSRLRRRPAEDPERFRWVAPEGLDDVPVSSLTRKLLRGLREPQLPLSFGGRSG